MEYIFGATQPSTEEDSSDSIPSYMIAANNHNTGNLNEDWFGTGQPQRSAINKAYNFVAGAALSGVNSFYNTAVWAGNMFSDEGAKYRDTRDWINSFDEDMGSYYDSNRQAIDLVGFVATSFVPGLGGVKVFNAGAKALTAAKEGVLGINMSRGLGVLPGSRDILLKEAVESFATTRTPFTLSNPQTVKAIASGFGEQVLQSAAFEVAVAATMKKSPILSDMDAGDMLTNIATGALVGGAIGGVIEGALGVYKIKTGIKALDTKLAGVTQIARGVDGTMASDSLLLRRNDLDTLPRNAPEGVDPVLYERQWEQKITAIDNKDREDFTRLTGDNAEVGNRLYEGMRTDPTGEYSAKLLGLVEIGSAKDASRIAKKYDTVGSLVDEPADDLTRLYRATPDGELTAIRPAGRGAEYVDVDKGWLATAAADDLATLKTLPVAEPTHSIRHFKLWGEDMGKVSDEAPAAMHLADTLSKGQSISVTGTKVVAGKMVHKVEIGKYWSSADASYNDALARNIWAMDDTVPPLKVPKGKTLIGIGESDLPMLTKAYREGFTDFNLIAKDGSTYTIDTTPQGMLQYLADAKNTLANETMELSLSRGGTETAEHISNRFDVPLSYLTGEQVSAVDDLAPFGLASAQKSYFDKFHANTVNPPEVTSVKPWLHQQNYQMVYDMSKVGGLDNFQVEAITTVMQRQKIQQETNKVAVLSALGEKAALLPEFSEAQLTRVNRGGAGAGLFSYANADYGTAGSIAEHVGGLVTRWIREAEDKVGNTMASVNYQIVNNPKDQVVLASVMQKVRAAGSEVYVRAQYGGGLELRSVRDYRNAVAAGEQVNPPVIPSGVDEFIPIESANAMAWVNSHIALNGSRVEKLNNLRGAKGQPDSLDPEAFYPPAPNPDRFKFHAFVVDDTKVTSTGHTTMLYADSARNLEKQIAEARAQGFNAFTPDESAAYYKARGRYDYTLGLNESQMDSALRRSGSSAPAFPLTGTPEEMIQDVMQWHAKQEAIVIREAVSTQYSKQFGVLYQMGEEYAKVSNSKIGFFNKLSTPPVNPFEDYVKTFMGASLKKDFPLWSSLNNFVDETGQKVYNAVSSVWAKSKSPYDLEEVNKVMQGYGMQMAATPAQMEAWVNHPAGRGAISKFVGVQNSILSSLVLRLDPVNALNNAVGSPILTGAETRNVLGLIAKGDDAFAKIIMPGTDDSLLSSGKLIASAYKNYFSPDSKALLSKYRERGYVSDVSTQFKNLIEEATIKGTETAAELESKAAKMYALGNKLVDKGEKWTGNKLSEEMNRFVSANIMDQLTAAAVKSGRMDAATADSYINTFVNRTQGNIIASQRPQLFQGPVGQAIGLFQSYQFNIMQQLLRYVGEGSKKDALTLLGLQGTVYGMNGLPAFQAINQHIIGNASGNTSHTDAYNSVYNIAGKTAGDWIMYGAASNMLIDPDLKLNLYSRGDINPRSITVVPTTMADIPIVSSWARLAGSIKNSLSSVANGGDMWQTFLSGVEQQGLNRPLAGLARVARGAGEEGVSYSTSGKGNIVSANDFYSLANFARLSGAKPFDEAVTQDAVYRIQAYQSKDKAMRDSLGKAVKSVIASGQEPSEEQMNQFIEGYAKAGGKQEEFNKWYVAQIRTMNNPQANKLAEKVGSPYASYMQSVMGGRLLATPPTLATPTLTGNEE